MENLCDMISNKNQQPNIFDVACVHLQQTMA